MQDSMKIAAAAAAILPLVIKALEAYEAYKRTGSVQGSAEMMLAHTVSGSAECHGAVESAVSGNYNESERSKHTDAMIKKLAEGLKTANLKDDGIDWSTLNPSADPKTLIDQINKQLDVGKYGSQFTTDSPRNMKIITNLAAIMNKAMNTGIVIKGRTAQDIGRDVFGILSLLNIGLTSDYVGIYAYLRAISDRSKHVVAALGSGAQNLKQLVELGDLNDQREKITNICEGLEKLAMVAQSENQRLAGLLEHFRDPNSIFYVDADYQSKEPDRNALQLLRNLDNKQSDYNTKVIDALGLMNAVVTRAYRVDKFLKTIEEQLGNNSVRDKYLDMSDVEFKKLAEGMLNDISLLSKQIKDPMNKVHNLREIVEQLVAMRKSNNFSELRPYLAEKSDVKGFELYTTGLGSVAGSAETYTEKFSDTIQDRINRIKRQRDQLASISLREIYSKFGAFNGILNTIIEHLKSGKLRFSDKLLQLSDIVYSLIELKGSKNLASIIGYNKVSDNVSNANEFTSEISRLVEVAQALNAPEYGDGHAVYGQLAEFGRGLIGVVDQSQDRFNMHDRSTGVGAVGSAEEADVKYTPAMNTLLASLSVTARNLMFELERKQGSDDATRGGKALQGMQSEFDGVRSSRVANTISDLQKEMESVLKAVENDKTLITLHPAATISAFAGTADMTADTMRNNIREYYTDTYSAVINLYKAAENIDIVLQKFVLRVSENPALIKDLVKIINNQVDIADWYSDKSGNLLATFFEKFPATMTATGATLAYTESGLNIDKDHYYKWLGDKNFTFADPTLPALPMYYKDIKAKADAAVGSIGAIKNLVNLFYRVSDDNAGFMSPVTLFKHLREYIVMSSVTMGYEKIAANGSTTDNTYPVYTLYKTDEAGSINYNYVDNRGIRVNDAYGTGAGGGAPATHAVRPSYLIYGQPAKSSINDAGGVVGVSFVSTSQHHGEYYVFAPTHGTHNADGGICLLKQSMAEYGVRLNYIYDKLKRGPLKEADVLFAEIIKSMFGQILSIVNMDKMNKQPVSYNVMSTIRSVIGSSEAVPEMDPTRNEIYFYIIMLAEYYYGLLGLSKQTTNEFFALLPESDGPFGPFIYLIFEKYYNDSGNYTERQLREMYNALNKVYVRCVPAAQSAKRDIKQYMIDEFITEMNKRWVLMSEDDRDKYEELLASINHKINPIEDTRMDNFAILPGEDADTTYDDVAPSNLYADGAFSVGSTRNLVKKKVEDRYNQLLRNFRVRMDSTSSTQNRSNVYKDVFELREMLRLAGKEISETKDPYERMLQSARLLGNGYTTNVTKLYKATLLHEVISGMNVLQKVLYKSIGAMLQILCMPGNDSKFYRERVFVPTVDRAGQRARALGKAAWTKFNMIIGKWIGIAPVPCQKGSLANIAPAAQFGANDGPFTEYNEYYDVNTHLVDFIQILSNLSQTKLVSVSVNPGGVNIDAGQLEDYCSDMLDTLGKLLLRLRDVAGKDHYEKLTANDKFGLGMMNVLVKDILFKKGKKEVDMTSGTGQNYPHLVSFVGINWDDVNVAATSVMKGFRDYSTNTKQTPSLHDFKIINAYTVQLDRAFRRMLFWDIHEPHGCLPYNVDEFANHFEIWRASRTVDKKIRQMNWRYEIGYPDMFAEPNGTDARPIQSSIMIELNRIVVQMLEQSVDVSSHKIYRKLLDPFASGAMSYAVNGKVCYPDTMFNLSIIPAKYYSFPGGHDAPQKREFLRSLGLPDVTENFDTKFTEDELIYIRRALPGWKNYIAAEAPIDALTDADPYKQITAAVASIRNSYAKINELKGQLDGARYTFNSAAITLWNERVKILNDVGAADIDASIVAAAAAGTIFNGMILNRKNLMKEILIYLIKQRVPSPANHAVDFHATLADSEILSITDMIKKDNAGAADAGAKVTVAAYFGITYADGGPTAADAATGAGAGSMHTDLIVIYIGAMALVVGIAAGVAHLPGPMYELMHKAAYVTTDLTNAILTRLATNIHTYIDTANDIRRHVTTYGSANLDNDSIDQYIGGNPAGNVIKQAIDPINAAFPTMINNLKDVTTDHTVINNKVQKLAEDGCNVELLAIDQYFKILAHYYDSIVKWTTTKITSPEAYCYFLNLYLDITSSSHVKVMVPVPGHISSTPSSAYPLSGNRYSRFVRMYYPGYPELITGFKDAIIAACTPANWHVNQGGIAAARHNTPEQRLAQVARRLVEGDPNDGGNDMITLIPTPIANIDTKLLKRAIKESLSSVYVDLLTTTNFLKLRSEIYNNELVNAKIIMRAMFGRENDASINTIEGIEGVIKTIMKRLSVVMIDVQNATSTNDFGNHGWCIRKDPIPEEVMFMSVGYLIYSLSTSMTEDGKLPRNIYETLSDVPEYKLDEMKANYPHLITRTKTTIHQLGHIRKMMQMLPNIYTDITDDAVTQVKENATLAPGDLARHTNSEFGSTPGTLDWCDFSKDDRAKTEIWGSQFRSKAILFCDNLNTYAQTILQTLTTVYNELGDKPIHMALTSNFETKFKSSYGNDAFMPLSSALVKYDPSKNSNESLLPNMPGSLSQKWQMANRAMYIEYRPESFKGEFDILTRYNSVVESTQKIQEVEYNTFVKLWVEGYKWGYAEAYDSNAWQHHNMYTHIAALEPTYDGRQYLNTLVNTVRRLTAGTAQAKTRTAVDNMDAWLQDEILRVVLPDDGRGDFTGLPAAGRDSTAVIRDYMGIGTISDAFAAARNPNHIGYVSTGWSRSKVRRSPIVAGNPDPTIYDHLIKSMNDYDMDAIYALVQDIAGQANTVLSAVQPELTIEAVAKSYAMTHDTKDVIMHTHNPDPNEAMSAYSTFNNNLSIKSRSRKDIRDIAVRSTNKVLINMNVAAKYIPLANIYNFAYVSTAIMSYYFDVKPSKTHGLTTLDNTQTFNETLVKFISDPYCTMTREAFRDSLTQIVTGSGGTKLNLGRTQYISDQLFNKVLLGSFATSPSIRDNIPVSITNHECITIWKEVMTFLKSEKRKGDVTRPAFGAGGGAILDTVGTLYAVLAISADPPVGLNSAELNSLANNYTTGTINDGGGGAIAIANNVLAYKEMSPTFNRICTTLRLEPAEAETLVTRVKAYINGILGSNRVVRDELLREYNTKHKPPAAADITDATTLDAQIATFIIDSLIKVLDGSDGADRRGNRSHPGGYQYNHITNTEANHVLSYYTSNGEIKTVSIPADKRQNVDIFGKIRFDTVLVRNLTFISLLHSLGAKILKESLFSQQGPVERGLPALSSLNYSLKQTDTASEAHDRRLESSNDYKNKYGIWT